MNPCQLMPVFDKWQSIFVNLSYDQFERKFTMLYKITNCSKLRDFQFRLLHKKLPSNKELYRWKLKNSPKCSFCDCKDSILHMLFDCAGITEVWQKVTYHVRKLESTDILRFDTLDLLINLVHPKPVNIINLQVLVLKQLIYRNKCFNRNTTFNEFLHEVQMIERNEEQVAMHSGKLDIHTRKWKLSDNGDANMSSYIQYYVYNM